MRYRLGSLYDHFRISNPRALNNLIRLSINDLVDSMDVAPSRKSSTYMWFDAILETIGTFSILSGYIIAELFSVLITRS